MQEFVTIDDLQNATRVYPIAEVHTIPQPDRSMQRRWHWLP
jgi:hypothetical protein